MVVDDDSFWSLVMLDHWHRLRLWKSLQILESPLVVQLVLKNFLSADRAAGTHDLPRLVDSSSSLPFLQGKLHCLQFCRLSQFNCLLRVVFELVQELVYVSFVPIDFVFEFAKLLPELILYLSDDFLTALVALGSWQCRIFQKSQVYAT